MKLGFCYLAASFDVLLMLYFLWMAMMSKPSPRQIIYAWGFALTFILFVTFWTVLP